MTVSEYRDLISHLSDTFASLRSAATPQERVNEAYRVRRLCREVAAADCRRAKPADRERAGRWAGSAQKYLDESGLAAYLAGRDVADANLQRMAFAADWR